MTIRDLLSRAQAPDARLLLAHVLRKPIEWLVAHDEQSVSFFSRLQFSFLCWKRKRGTPLAYLTGTKDFFGRTFHVSKHTLVPRPESELLIELGLADLKQREESIITDIGTGSGALAITMALETNNTVPVHAIDISSRALRIAQKNAALLHASVSFYQGNLLAPLFEEIQQHTDHTLIIANLPYVPTADWRAEPSIQSEPRLALDGGDDGLDLYRVLFLQLRELDINDATILCEIDPSQSGTLPDLVRVLFPAAAIEVKKDLAGLDRVVIVSLM